MSTTTYHSRFRFRCESLKFDEKAKAVKEALTKTKGVVEVAVNKRVGSLLVIFDHAKIRAEQLFSTIASSLGMDPEQVKDKLRSVSQAINSKRGRRYVKRGLLGAGVITLSLLTISEDAHAFSGVIWLSLMATHIYQNRRTLFS
ncbi:HMA2 domain-containing protein [Halodesulfovibrio marinisediminis]|uniref:Uncharacterized protein n=1 Tax=Halodesulfovibrio marinisediminis DSM 17456 TaxID=1121457 RepID=A0A1N6FUU3_9BACT|nr:hypothetical protein [Halodesulfovibrio marinisediminis]SIN99023.1 hypothetical protein SAMN02745161_1525 [Halodesulfovibrio marinisediminis DSM 17456]